MVAAGECFEDEEERGQQRVASPAEAEEPEEEEQDQGQPLRAERAQVGDLVGADGGEGEGGSGEEGRQLGGGEAAHEEVGGQRREHEREQPGQVEDENRVVGDEEERQHEQRGAEDGFVHAQRVAQRMEHVAVRQPRRIGLQRVRLPCHHPGEVRGITRVHRPQAESERCREQDGEDEVERRRAQRPHARPRAGPAAPGLRTRRDSRWSDRTRAGGA